MSGALLMFIAICLIIFPIFASKTSLKDSSLQHLSQLNLQHGYPVNVFGGLFPTFAVKSTEWSLRDCILDSISFSTTFDRCRLAIEALYGVHGANEYSKLMREGSRLPLQSGRTIKPDEKTMNSWTKELYKVETVLFPIYSQLDITPDRDFSRISGLINSERLVKIREVMERCVSSLATPLERGGMLEWACGYAEFLAIMHESDVGLPTYFVVPRNDASEMSGRSIACDCSWRATNCSL